MRAHSFDIHFQACYLRIRTSPVRYKSRVKRKKGCCQMFARALAGVLTFLASLSLIGYVAPAGAVEPQLGRVSNDIGSRWGFNKQERCVMNKINKARRNKGLSALRADKQVGVVARRHAKSMAANYSVFHDSNMGHE